MRICFSSVLATTLQNVEDELAADRFGLYAMLLDMYNVSGFPESLEGILTINYDDYIEAAISHLTGGAQDAVNYGIDFPSERSGAKSIELLNSTFVFLAGYLAGPSLRSAGGRHPTVDSTGNTEGQGAIPIQLALGPRPEMLRCDVLRIIGCRLSPNDWDLIALLFTTRHAEGDGKSPYTVEIIDSPSRAQELKQRYPYLNVTSIVEI